MFWAARAANVRCSQHRRRLRLIDWGLAEFYRPQQRYNIHVASRDFKPIELLADYQCYDYSIDIWSFGVTMAGIVFRQMPFFAGRNDMDVVTKISDVLGRSGLQAYLEKYGIPPEPIMKYATGKGRPWESLVTDQVRELATPAALDLIDKCVRYDHMERITAAEALEHPYFDRVRHMPAG
jgi:casein kinase II subunit alpha